MPQADDATRVRSGDCHDGDDALLPLVYEELRRLADRYLRDEGDEQTLPPTALVHEVYLRLQGHEGWSGANRAGFFSIAARAMRNLLIDHARRRRATKRGGARRAVSLEGILDPSTERCEYIIALDDALRDLAAIDPQLARLVELRFFGGLRVEETARVLGIAPATVKRRWRLARGWLHRQISSRT